MYGQITDIPMGSSQAGLIAEMVLQRIKHLAFTKYQAKFWARGGECSCGHLSHLWLLKVGFFPAATTQTTVTTGGLNQVRVSGVVLPTHLVYLTPELSTSPPLKKSCGGSESNPERRTALVARKLARYKVDIAALSETGFSEQGQLEEVGAGHTFFWSGRPKAARRNASVAFAIRNDIDKFYENLNALLATVLKVAQLIVLDDFKARVGTNHTATQRVLGPHGLGSCNDNGLLLLRTCAEHRLFLTNTFFRLPTREKVTWMHPRSRRLHLLYYVLVRRRDRQDVLIIKAIRDADGWTDHRLVISQTRLRLKPRRRPQHKSQSLIRCAEHFKSVLNCASAISEAAIDWFPQVDTNNDLDLSLSLPETIRAMQQISSGKSPDSDAIPPKVYKYDGPRLMAELTTLFQEMRTHLSTTFVDLTKAFETLNRDGLWKVMPKVGCPERFMHMVRQLHEGMTARDTDNGTVSEAFAVTNGVKQGCVLAPTLFSLMFSAMLMDAYRNEQPGIRIAYRTDRHLLNSRCMQAPTRVFTTTVYDLLFADDCALNTVTEEDIQRSMDLFAEG
ncbi:unnamed protein product [Schistocephalus solidus]|uniref:Reverse transcriptase domain-containing protein n=1 Tax=Schistocephalus solidus TaxID=70667 RepID=A0A183TBM6_SCHSO|nr:unnamed protein product [Schistocephalus solidus]